MIASIIVSSFKRVNYFKRVLWSIANRPPKIDFELIVVDEKSDEDILPIVQEFAAGMKYKFIRFNLEEYERRVGRSKYWNCSAPCVNIGWKNSTGDLIYLIGNDTIVWGQAFNTLYDDYMKTLEKNALPLVFASTYDCPPDVLELTGDYAQNITQSMVNYCKRWPLQDKNVQTLVFNYLSLSSRKLWDKIGGVDERYFEGISGEDSDFVRRARAIGSQTVFSEAVTLHQQHGGKTMYNDPLPEVIAIEKFNAGCKINRKLYDSWDGGFENEQGWPIGVYGVEEIITNF